MLNQMHFQFDTTRNVIYIDLDGVLADFDGKVLEVTGRPSSSYKTETEKLAAWEQLVTVDDLFGSLELLPGALDLWAHVNALGAPVKILTALPSLLAYPQAEAQKRRWVERHLGPEVTVLFGPYAADKWRHAAPADILIDDQIDNVVQWISRGHGIGILHESVDETMEALARQVHPAK
jgi:hypothetical protein